ncbi:helix-turn-helix domain-containing protein [Brevundimonas sp.]|uniref:helix-turn-helix domain-containing protein n=1 Tax=Brevundimonas sp. TaxID=1871086 RepID=UPI0028A1281D|nr:helix-turn-helix domain-containing protein [Brevundimonas sp.]
MTRQDYRYDECGLDNVILVGLSVCEDDQGEATYTIPNINRLHRSIMAAVAAKPTGLNGKELRFLRTELGLTQSEMAEIVSKDTQTIGRWERNEKPIDGAAETVIRLLATQHADGAEPLPRVEDVAKRSVASSGEPPFQIDATDPEHYRPIMPIAA